MMRGPRDEERENLPVPVPGWAGGREIRGEDLRLRAVVAVAVRRARGDMHQVSF